MDSHLKNAAAVLAVFAICAFIQKQVFAVPVVGRYLPGGDAAKA